MKKAFTLIELLLVFAIIGLLSALVLVGVKTSKEKSKIAASKQFGANINHALGADAVGVWTFDNVGANVPDDSGNGLTGTIHGSPDVVDGIIRKALYFDGSSDYIQIDNETAFDNIADFTYSAWIKSDNPSGGWNTIIDLCSDEKDWCDYQQFAVSSRKIAVYVYSDSPYCYYSNSFGSIDTNWHHVAWTKSIGNYKVYIDGKEVGSGVPDPNCVGFDVGWAQIGASGGENFAGTIDELGFYKRALTSAEVYRIYAEGAERRGLAVEQ